MKSQSTEIKLIKLPDDEAPAASVRLWERDDGQLCIGIEFDGKLVLLESIEDRQRTDQVAHTLHGWLGTARLVLDMAAAGKA